MRVFPLHMTRFFPNDTWEPASAGVHLPYSHILFFRPHFYFQTMFTPFNFLTLTQFGGVCLLTKYIARMNQVLHFCYDVLVSRRKRGIFEKGGLFLGKPEKKGDFRKRGIFFWRKRGFFFFYKYFYFLCLMLMFMFLFI
jgi:hypothetical protein